MSDAERLAAMAGIFEPGSADHDLLIRAAKLVELVERPPLALEIQPPLTVSEWAEHYRIPNPPGKTTKSAAKQEAAPYLGGIEIAKGERDPRTDPRSGDTLRKWGQTWIVMQPPWRISKDGVTVRYCKRVPDPRQMMSAPIDKWRITMADAEVLRVNG